MLRIYSSRIWYPLRKNSKRRITMAEKLTYEEILADPENLVCVCNHDGSEGGMPLCSHRTICDECILIHKVEGGIPTCLRLYTDHKFPLPDMKIRFANEKSWLADPENRKCVCTEETDGKPCVYRGKCKECIAINRYYKGYPSCLPDFPVLSDDKITAGH